MSDKTIEDLPVEYQELARTEGLRAVEELLNDSPASLGDVAKLQVQLERIAHPWSLKEGEPVIQLDALPYSIPESRLPYYLQEHVLERRINELAGKRAREHRTPGWLIALLFLVSLAAGVLGIIF